MMMNPIADLPDDVSPGDEFELNTYVEKDGAIEALGGSYFVQFDHLEDSQFENFLEFGTIDPMDNY